MEKNGCLTSPVICKGNLEPQLDIILHLLIKKKIKKSDGTVRENVC